MSMSELGESERAVPIHLGLIRHPKRSLHINPSPHRPFHCFQIPSFPRTRDEINDSLDRFDHLHLFGFPLRFPLVSSGTLVRGYPVHSQQRGETWCPSTDVTVSMSEDKV